ncbi:MAG: DUF2459 domain-containing protein [Alphaproteobacteria bacterium]|nr:DUF2459 domain-containing protein [Alphaproteobacteria bacterium]
MMSRRVLAAMLALLCLGACSGAAEGVGTETGDARRLHAQHEIQIVSNGWHTGIVLPRAARPEGLMPEIDDLPDSEFLRFGWGDREYYPAARPTLAMTLNAALAPTPAVLHVVALLEPALARAAEDEVRTILLTADQLRRLYLAIDGHVDRAGAARAMALSEGSTRNSRFYPATGRFHLFNTCNTWTARLLEDIGYPVRASGVITAEEVMRQLRPR